MARAGKLGKLTPSHDHLVAEIVFKSCGYFRGHGEQMNASAESAMAKGAGK